MKDTAVEVSVKAFINQEIAEFGVVASLEDDSNNKAMRLDLESRGETSLVLINEAIYDLSEVDGKFYLAFGRGSTCGEWITIALEKYVVGR